MKHPFDSRQLRAFLCLAQHGSFTSAARELSLTQSAVSHSIKALEDDLGCTLFDRVGKKVLLTLAGEHLRPHVDEILNRMERARAEVTRLGEWGQSRLRLCASSTACQYILPSVLREFRKSFPKVQISIEPGDTDQAIDFLRARRVDISICLEPPEDTVFEFKPLFSDELVFVVSPEHPWAQTGRVDRESIPKQQYVLYNKGTYTFRMIEQYFAQDETSLSTVIELRNMEAIKELVKLGLGASILAPWTVQKELAEGTLISFPLGRRKLVRRWGILHWRNPNLPLAQTQFISLCGRVCNQLAEKQKAATAREANSLALGGTPAVPTPV
jgi:LysR family transcriptional regulator, low CO2-responsive transcriptional regulator